MKITKQQLKQIIKEEISNAISEGALDIDTGVPAMSPEEIERERMEDELEKNYADPVERERARQKLVDAGKLPARKN